MPLKTPHIGGPNARPAAGNTTRAMKGDSLWSIAEKTVPKGKSVNSWFNAIKKMNTKNGQVRKIYQNTGVSLPPGAQDRRTMPGPGPTVIPKRKATGSGR